MVENHFYRNARGHIGAEDIDGVVLLDLGVVERLGEGEGEDALLLEIGLVDTREALGQDDLDAEVARFHSSVLAAGAFAVIVFSDHNAAAEFLGARSDRAGLAGESVDGAEEEIVGYVLEMTAELEPRAGH